MELKKPIFIFGIGQQAQLAYYYFKNDLQRQVKGFVIDFENHPTDIFGLPVLKLKDVSAALKRQESEIFVAIGSVALNSVREYYVSVFLDLGAKLASCISPRCLYGANCGESLNTFIDPSSVLEPFTSFGQNLILYNAIVSHHCEIGDNVSINSAMVGANCRIGRNTMIALSATVESGVSIGECSLIDSGSLVKDDLPPYSVVVAHRCAVRKVDSRRVKLFGESLNGFRKKMKIGG